MTTDATDELRQQRFHSVKIKAPLDVTGGEVFLDDFSVKGLRKIDFSFEVGSLPVVILEIYPYTINGHLASPEALKLSVCKAKENDAS